MTDLYAVIGNPVAHSRSPAIHAAFARQTGQDLRYEAILAPLDGFGAAVERFLAAGGKGLNVTLPFKREAFRLAVQRTDRAAQAGAVNTLKFDREAILGDNTDGAGLVRDLERNLGFPLRGKRILLLGAGGAAQGVTLPLLARQPALLVVANRTAEKALALQRQFSPWGRVASAGYEALAGERFDLVVNATSASLSDQLPPLPAGVFAPGALAYDMVYGKRLTRFLEYAREHGAARLADGLGMLVEQAAESFFVWRGVWPDGKPVIDMLRVA